MSPFDPIGDKARWRYLYERLATLPTDGVLTYDEMGEILDLDPTADRHAIQMAMRRAAREHEETDKRAVESVPNVGYRVVEAPEHMRLAQRQQKRSSRALARGRSKVVNVDMNQLEPETRRVFEVVAQAFSLQMDFNRRTDVRQRQLENTLTEISEGQRRSAEELAALRERLDRLENGSKQEGTT